MCAWTMLISMSRLCLRGTPLARPFIPGLAKHFTSAAHQRTHARLDLSAQLNHTLCVARRSTPVARCAQFSTNLENVPKETKVKTDTTNLDNVPKETEVKTDIPKDTEPKSYIQKVKRVLKEYGTVAVVFHTAISLASYGTCYLLVKHGLDVDKVLEYFNIHTYAIAKGASTAAIAYILHKIFLPLRATTTIVCAPLIVKQLRIKGWMKTPGSVPR